MLYFFGSITIIRHADTLILNTISKTSKNIGSVDGLVFGGSNAVYSLSAEFLSYYTGVKWYNASVVGELQTINRHKNFIRDLSARIDRTKVRYVVYSSVLPYSIGKIAAYKSDKKIRVGDKAKESVLGYIKRLY